MRAAKLRVTLKAPNGVELGSVEMRLNDIIRNTGWSPANTSAVPDVWFSWILEDFCGPQLHATGIFNDQGID